MEQTEIFSAVFQRFEKKINELTNDDKLINLIKKLNCRYETVVNDISQYEFDDNERILVDERLFNPPSKFQMVMSVVVTGKDLPSVLEYYGIIARYLKDNPGIDISDCNWHLNQTQKIYLVPVIHSPESRRESRIGDGYSFTLQYAVTLELNSQNSVGFTRVRERVVQGNVKK